MFQFILALFSAVRVFFRSRHDTALEILALRQQVAVLKRKRPRPPLNLWDPLFWTTLRRVWSRWTDVLILVKPETVVGWHRAGFRLFWKWRSRAGGGRPATTAEIRTLIRRVAEENPTWGAPKIHGELLKLGFTVSERTVARYLRRVRRRGDPGQGWLTFLANHREIIAALDFFTIPTVTFTLLYCFFVIEHGRRKIRHFNVTRHPTAEWVVQQLREAFPEIGPLRYIVLDRDAKFNADVLAFLKATGLLPKRTSIQSPWQNGIAERWVGGCRRELLDHVIPLNEEHLRRLVRDYVSYFHEDRSVFTMVSPRRSRARKRRCFPALAWAVSIIAALGGRQRNGHAGSLRTDSVIVGGSFGGRPARFLDCPKDPRSVQLFQPTHVGSTCIWKPRRSARSRSKPEIRY